MDWCGLVEAAKALREDGRLDEAEGDLAKAISEFRDIESILADYGWAAQRERKWAEAVPRWELYRRRFPSHFLGYALGCAALRESGRLDEADSVAAEGLRLFPDHPEVVANFAWVANRRGDWHETLRRWQMYAAAFPDDPLGYVFAGNTLREMRLYEQADCVLRQGLKDHPTHPELLSRYASVAYDRQDWPEALRRWTDFRDRHPDLPWGHQQVAAVLGWMGRFAEADDQSRTARAHLADPTLAQLVLRFEGLGDNCEFGLVQRHFGAEPLGLLRWTGITPAHLANALESGFAGVGTEDQTGLDLAGNEYVTEDRRFGMRMHAFIPGSLSDRDHIFAQQCRRIRFLRDKILRDLESAEKIFLYKRDWPLSEAEMFAISKALRQHGSNRLLCVVLAEDGIEAGTIRSFDDYLAVGYMDRLSKTARYDEINYGSWIELLKQAYARFSP